MYSPDRTLYLEILLPAKHLKSIFMHLYACKIIRKLTQGIPNTTFTIIITYSNKTHISNNLPN